MSEQKPQWDVFISYASEDRDLAAPLAEGLAKLGVLVWFDKTELHIGDSLRERIDDGLSRCRYGVIVLSTHFLNKHYPQRELNGLAQREIYDGKIILPIWKGISHEEVSRYSPPLADKVALVYENNLSEIIDKITNKVRPDIIDTIKSTIVDLQKEASKYKPLNVVSSGKILVDSIRNAQITNQVHEELTNQDEVDKVGGLLDYITDLIDTLEFCSTKEEAQIGIDITQQLSELKEYGWLVYTGQRDVYFKNDDKRTKFKQLAIAVVRSDCEGVFIHKDEFLIQRAEAKTEGL